jgi:hypothetical protein
METTISTAPLLNASCFTKHTFKVDTSGKVALLADKLCQLKKQAATTSFVLRCLRKNPHRDHLLASLLTPARQMDILERYDRTVRSKNHCIAGLTLRALLSHPAPIQSLPGSKSKLQAVKRLQSYKEPNHQKRPTRFPVGPLSPTLCPRLHNKLKDLHDGNRMHVRDSRK